MVTSASDSCSTRWHSVCSARGRCHRQHRRVHLRRDQFYHHGLCGIHDRKNDQQDQRAQGQTGTGSTDHEKVPVLQIRDRHRGNPLPALHICAGCDRRRAAEAVSNMHMILYHAIRKASVRNDGCFFLSLFILCDMRLQKELVQNYWKDGAVGVW